MFLHTNGAWSISCRDSSRFIGEKNAMLHVIALSNPLQGTATVQTTIPLMALMTTQRSRLRTLVWLTVSANQCVEFHINSCSLGDRERSAGKTHALRFFVLAEENPLML